MTADCWSARGARAVQGLALRLKINACVGSACLQRAPVSQHTRLGDLPPVGYTVSDADRASFA